ncbi:hypothetical protein D1P53_002896 [Cryptococcus gattii VGV]|nr:hypothetical protein D1P53_002896 [Cryptococcus gattii VGV]
MSNDFSTQLPSVERSGSLQGVLPDLPTSGGRRWFVTGSSRGLGRDIVVAALKAGDKVFATARNPAQLDDLVKEYPNLITGQLDVNDPDACAKSLTTAAEKLGGIDVVCNNAGYANLASVEDMEIADFKQQFDTNFFGTLYVSKAAIPYLRKNGGGHILQICTLGSRLGVPGLTAYGSAKWAVCGFSKSLNVELKPFGIHVVTLQPGGMRTDWSGSSMDIPKISDGYEPTIGHMATMLRAYNGKEPTDPAKLGEICVRLSRHPDPPVELLIGADAVHHAAEAAQTRKGNDETWKAVSLSAGYD